MSCGNPHQTPCTEVLDEVYQYLDGELDEHAVGKIRQHLAECGPCLAEYKLDIALKALIRRSCGGDCAPVDLRNRIMVQITQVRIHLG
ncbi:MAG TPA: mycothiol system anti-sigma-R factor [Kineosporiaceae bacterium]|jgi:mycothiol system anti-sigma-R factor|nr:mycothiol system anti-sigma-R factor [Kineosporiaceae bacterium]